MKSKSDIYQDVTDSIISAIEAGTVPWHRPWGTAGGMPLRVTGEPYRGINVIILAMQGRSNATWMTYRQAAALKGQVRKGEKGTGITFFKMLSDRVDPDKMVPLLRGYTVFNVEQIDGLPERFYPVAAPVNPEARRDDVNAYFANADIEVRHGGDKAFYSPSKDFVQLPNFDTFKDAASYYSTKGHEYIHATGHASRCDRDLKNSKGLRDYAKEELTAELGAAFLMASLGVSSTPRPDHASYIEGWLKALKGDKKYIFAASTLAQKAVDWLENAQPVEQEAAA